MIFPLDLHQTKASMGIAYSLPVSGLLNKLVLTTSLQEASFPNKKTEWALRERALSTASLFPERGIVERQVLICGSVLMALKQSTKKKKRSRA